MPQKTMTQLRIFVDLATPPEILKMLQEGTRGHELVFPPAPVSSVLSQAPPDPKFSTVDIAFGQPDPRAIQQASHLKWVHISSSGITRYDTPEFRAFLVERKITLSNSATVYQESCALHALSFLLAQARNLPLALKTRVANIDPPWQALRESCAPLQGKTVLILGYGAIGKRLVELLRPFHMTLLAYRRKARGDEEVPVLTRDQLDHALAHEADHVINILPASAETHHFFNESRFSTMKPGAIFYNIGRGATVDQQALLAALRSGRIGAAWLDVTEPEPLPDDHPLWTEPHCHITPHVAGGHENEAKTLVAHFLDNFQRFVKGEPLLDRVL